MVKKAKVIKSKDIKVSVYNAKGETSTSMSLPPAVFGNKVNKSILNQAVRVYLANNRQGSSSTKTRGEVSGGGKKPWQQKHTGRARQGSIRAPHWRGGGIVFGPKSRDYSLNFPQKMTKQALYTALSSKAANQKIRILNTSTSEFTKTKLANTLIKKIYDGQNYKNILLITNKNNSLLKSFRNIDNLTIRIIENLNTYDVLKHDEVLFIKEAVAKYES